MIINDLDGYYIVFDTKNWNTELDTLTNKLTNHWHRHFAILHRIVDGQGFVLQCTMQSNCVLLLCTIHGNSTCIVLLRESISTVRTGSLHSR